MINVLVLKISKRLSKIFLDFTKSTYENKYYRHYYPLIHKSKNKIKSTNGFYWRFFQSKIKTIDGMTSDEEAEKLFFLSAFQDLKGDIVEIGSWLGKSTVHLAKGCQLSGNGVVHAVDIFKGNVGKESMYNAPLNKNETIISRFKKNIRIAKVNKNIVIHAMTSAEASKKVNNKLRLIFIDGCHDYEFVNEDIQLWSKKLRKNGIIVLDDFTVRFPGVVRAAEENIINNKNFRVVLNYDSFLIAQKIK
jgi:predicted O-methyltransferase YrrM